MESSSRSLSSPLSDASLAQEPLKAPKRDFHTSTGSMIRSNIIILGIVVGLTFGIGPLLEPPLPPGAPPRPPVTMYTGSKEHIYTAWNSQRTTGSRLPSDFFIYKDATGSNPSRIGGPIPAGELNQGRVYNGSLLSYIPQHLISVLYYPTYSPVYSGPVFNETTLPVLEPVSTSTSSAEINSLVQQRATAFFESCQCKSSYSYCYNYDCSVSDTNIPKAIIDFTEYTDRKLRYSAQPAYLTSWETTKSSGLRPRSAAIMNMFTSALYRMGTNETFNNTYCIFNTSSGGSIDSNSRCNISQIRTSSAYLSAYVNEKVIMLIQLSAIVFALILPLPLFMHRIVLERRSGMSAMIAQNGMGAFAYWFSNFLSDFIIYLFVLAPILIVGAAIDMTFVSKPTYAPLEHSLSAVHSRLTQSHPRALFYAPMFLLPFGLIPAAYLLSLIFTSPARATAFAYVWTLLTFGAAWALNATVLQAQALPPIWYIWYPPWALFRAGWVIIFDATLPSVVSSQQLSLEAVVDSCAIVLFGIVALVLTAWLDSFLPKKGTTLRSPFTSCMCCRPKKTLKVANGSKLEYTELDEVSSSMEDVESATRVEDAEVKAEKARVLQGKIPADSAVVISEVSKVWGRGDDRLVALDSVCIHLEKDEVFGLLGPNGAGKSTLIKIMTGEEIATSGTVYIGGYDISKSRQITSEIIGLCPQFDVLWDELSVEDHLLFYCRLKGVPRAMESARVAELIRDVGLEGEKNRLAAALSGGQKRRLSIAVALAGKPSVVFLDEPSTGLDPATRRGLWDTLADLKKNRCFLITTHLMEEAEVLCSRIGILSKGNLKCLGDKQRLKALYGTGYKIDISADVSNHDRIHAYITALIPEAQLVAKTHASMVYRVQGVTLSLVYGEIERNKSRYGIRNWGLSQSSLDDVFVRIVKDDEKLDG